MLPDWGLLRIAADQCARSFQGSPVTGASCVECPAPDAEDKSQNARFIPLKLVVPRLWHGSHRGPWRGCGGPGGGHGRGGGHWPTRK